MSAHHEIRARLLCAAVDAGERAGIDVRHVYDGLPFDDIGVRRLTRVEWQHYCVVIERLEARAGSPEAYQRAVAENFHRMMPELSAVAGSFIGPKEFYRFNIEVVSWILLPPLRSQYESRGTQEIRITGQLREGVRPCLAFFRASAGVWTGMTSHLGLPPADVKADVSPVSGVYDVKLPPSRTIGARLARASRGAADRIVAHLLLGLPTALPRDDLDARLQALARRHDLTRRQIDVFAHLSRGRANKQIASALDCAESTVEAHVTHLLRKLGAGSRAELISHIWS